MLDYRAVPFYPPPDMGYYTKRNNEEQKRHNKKSKKSNIGIERNDSTEKQNNENKEPKTTIETNTLIEEDWITVKKTNIKMKAVREAIQKAYIQDVKNRYKNLQTNEDEMEVEEEFRIEEIGKERVEVKKEKSYDIREITVEEMVKYINEYKDEDYILRDGNGKDETVKTIEEETESEEEDEISNDEADDSDDSLCLMEEESISSDGDDEMTADGETENDPDAEEELQEDNKSYKKMNKVGDDKENTNENEESLSAEEE